MLLNWLSLESLLETYNLFSTPQMLDSWVVRFHFRQSISSHNMSGLARHNYVVFGGSLASKLFKQGYIIDR